MRCAKALGATPLFSRPHYQRIARLLEALNGPLLREHHCLFGGGTAIALKFGEYRESVDVVDFLVSEIGDYRGLRNALTGVEGLGAIIRQGAAPLEPASGLTADQYGIRTRVVVDGRRKGRRALWGRRAARP